METKAQRFPECRSLERHSLSSLGRVVESSYWYFIKIESDSGISQ
ncbi:hypothetical protein [Leptospira noguchii]|nr:hypothetical protein [Leptospira noguchii]